MLSKDFSNKIHKIVRHACTLQVMPFKFNRNTHRLEHKAELQVIPFFAITILLGLHSAYIIIRMVTSTKYLKHNFAEFCICMFLVIFITDQFVFRWNFWKKRRHIAWLFNQVQQINESFAGKMPQRANIREKIMATWPEGHFAMFLSVVLSFLLTPTKLQHPYSLLPEPCQGTWTLGIFFCIEFLSWGSAMASEATELIMQTFSLQSFIWWTQLSVQSSLSEVDKTIRVYRRAGILLKSFTYCYGAHIEQLKSTVTIALVFINYGLLKKHDEIHLFYLSMLSSSCIVGHLLPPLMYNNAFAVFTNSHCIRSNLLHSIARSQVSPSGRRYYRQVIASMHPLRVKVIGLYFLDRTMTPLYYLIITNYTVSFLLMFR